MFDQLGKFLIIGHYGAQNAGDDAMLAGLLWGAGPGLSGQLVVATKNGTLTPLLCSAGAKVIRASPWGVLRELLKTQNLVLGGGTHFHDDYTLTRYLRHLRYMLGIVGVSFLAKLLRNKVVWLSMGFGPFLRKPTRWITEVGLKLCDRVTVRDEISRQEIASWVPAHKLKLTFDLSALLLLCDRLPPPATSAPREKSMILGLSATSVQTTRTGGPTVNDFFWEQMVHALADVFSVSKDLSVRVFVMGTEKRNDDTSISTRIHGALSSVDPTRVQLVPYQPNPLETLVKMAECRALIATRFHAALLAYLAGCDLFLVAYHRKLNDLANELRLSQQACVPVGSDTSEAVLRAKIAELIRGAPWSKPRLPVQEAVRRAWLNIDVLKEILNSP